MKAEVYIRSINVKRVIPIYHTTKNKKLKEDVDSQLAKNNMPSVLLNKRKQKQQQLVEGITTSTYSLLAIEILHQEASEFDQRA